MRKTMKLKREKGGLQFSKIFRRIGNSNLGILITCASVIMIWRGIWDLCDVYIFPDNKLLSDIICLIIGIVVLLIDDGKLKELI